MQSKILIVDDEPGIRSLIMAYLQKEGYDVKEAADGPSAIEYLRKHSNRTWSSWISCCPAWMGWKY